MPSFPCVHHVEVGVVDGPKAVNILRKNYTFDVVATRNSKVARQWLLVKSDTNYVVTCLKTESKDLIQKDDYVIDWMDFPSRDGVKRQRKDSVFNVCLQVDSIDQSLARLQSNGVHPFRNIKVLSDSFGCVRICTIKSCVGDVYHTLVEKESYSGVFLPGFKPVNHTCDPLSDNFWITQDELTLQSNDSRLCNRNDVCGSERTALVMADSVGSGYSSCAQNDVLDNSIVSSKTDGDQKESRHSPSIEEKDSTTLQDKNRICPVWTTFDHVAFAVEMGTSPGVISWYERCFGMKRFMINSEEDPAEGLVLNTDNVSLRLRAMEYWKCSETGLAGPKTDVNGNRLSMVIGEGLPPVPGATEENQIESWLRQHGGPGIQHIALNTGNIKATVGSLKRFGAAFANPPPPAYYSEVGRLYDIQRTGEDLESLRQHGILIDTEADSNGDDSHCDGNGKVAENAGERYLLQIFTKPIFPKDPFFMEIIQREGATGFGSGNVAALYRSVQACIIEKAQDIL